MSSRYQKEISSAVKGISQHIHIKFIGRQTMSELTFGLLTDEVSRVLPSLVIQDQEDSPRPKIAAHVTGNYIPEKDGGGMSSSWKYLIYQS